MTFRSFPMWLALACVLVGAVPWNERGMAAEPAPKRGTANYEIRFMKNMIDHHQMAVMTSALCQDRAISEDLLMLCAEIHAAQTAEIELMQTYLEDWYGISYEPTMTRRMTRQMQMLASLEGEDFEIAFMQMMIRHHADAVKAGGQCVRRACHEELIELCENIVATQQMEIALMEMWLCDWYAICD